MGLVADCFDNTVAESTRRRRGLDHPAGSRGGRSRAGDRATTRVPCLAYAYAYAYSHSRPIARSPDRLLLAAGAITDATDVRDVRDVQVYGADVAVAGSRFLLTHECHAHPAYQQRVIETLQAGQPDSKSLRTCNGPTPAEVQLRCRFLLLA